MSAAGIGQFFVMPKSTLDTSMTSYMQVPSGILEIRQIWLTGCFVYQGTLSDKPYHTRLLYRSLPDPDVPVTQIFDTKMTVSTFRGFQLWDSDVD
jgi:hypothetical protein